jgi:SAM-dependent methyltransferase
MAEDTRRFYDDLAGSYHLLFGDWPASVHRQGEVLDRLITSELGDGPYEVLDAACGIGTQAIGLAMRGHRVHATDLSPAAVDRAAREAAVLGVTLITGVADLRTLTDQVPGPFDVVVACDNALPHLLTDSDLQQATSNMAAVLRAGGLLAASIRDYDALTEPRLAMDSLRVIGQGAGRRITFQTWDWAEDGGSYRVTQFLLTQDSGSWRTEAFSADYRALMRDELSAALSAAGFDAVRWHEPDQSGFYQPIVTARAR